MAANPRRIYGLAEQPDTKVIVDMTPTVIGNEDMHSKCGWTPFAGMEVAGRVQKVILRGQTAYENGQVVASPGSGKVIS
jgi:carbamoyl-phosphate synthase/aspartate carbamoyltransferase/dihydroorotase